MIYTYGYTETISSESSQAIVKSYIERNDHNILVIEWSKYNIGNYIFEAIPQMKVVSEAIGRALLEMKSLRFNFKKFHLIGHSLGGQMIGYIARSLSSLSKNTTKLQRITSLDPAGPFFYGLWSTLNKHLSRDDGKTSLKPPPTRSIIFFLPALFVDVIHTDKMFFGAPESTGTVDFWPNGGEAQYGCLPGSWNVYEDESEISDQALNQFL